MLTAHWSHSLLSNAPCCTQSHSQHGEGTVITNNKYVHENVIAEVDMCLKGKGGGRGPISSAGPGPPKHVKTALGVSSATNNHNNVIMTSVSERKKAYKTLETDAA